MDNVEYEIQQLRQELYQVKVDIYKLSSNVDSISLVLSNQTNHFNTLVQYINLQSTAINEVNQTVQKIYNKLSDVEISQGSVEDTVQEYSTDTKVLSGDLQEIKSSIDTIKFYIQNLINYKQ